MDPMQTALDAAKIGGKIAAEYFNQGTEARGKTSGGVLNTHELLTDADLASEKAIVEKLRSDFPEHAILAEEEHQAELDSEHLWIVDPIDGTNNFAHRIPHWAVSIAYYHLGEPVCGVVYNPIRNDLFEAQRGSGARHNGEPIHVSTEATIQQAIIAAGFYYDRGEMMQATLNAIGDLFRARIHGIRRMGTAALDMCQVAIGWYGGYFEYELSPWDFAAGRLIVEEAGGKFTDCQGKIPSIDRTSVLVSNTLVHDQILEIVGPHLPESSPRA